MGSDTRPLIGDDRVVDGIANHPVACTHVSAQYTLENHAKPFDCSLSAFVAQIGLDRHAFAVHGAERMAEHEHLHLGVRAATTMRGSQPRPADFAAGVPAVDVAEPSCPNRVQCSGIQHRERNALPGISLIEDLLNIGCPTASSGDEDM
jgi:hypothetical protein